MIEGPLFKSPVLKLNEIKLIIITAVFLVVFTNYAFFSHALEKFPVTANNIGFLLSLVILHGAIIVIFLSLTCIRYTTKPLLITILVVSSSAAYFMDSYNVIIDDTMILNILHTNLAETLDLINYKLILYISLLGLLPSYIIYKTEIEYTPFLATVINRSKLVFASIIVSVTCILLFGSHYASFIRLHKSLRYYANPEYYIYSTYTYLVSNDAANGEIEITHIAQGAEIPESDTERELIIMIAGETARADRFSLNGYQRETTPLLKQLDVLSYTNVWSCGTSTAVSLPCEFSIYNHDEYDKNTELHTENLLDILKHAGVNVLWRDNNSSSKGVAVRQTEENFRTPDNNPDCDIECRDTGMLSGLQQYIDSHSKGDIFIVLHQMGSHGPAYYHRYPESFEKFTPTCKTNQLESCTNEEINNTYDNTILYTDYFLSEVIRLLKNNSNNFETVMFYISDHGESLGEKGLYLHGLPDLIAPDVQKHVPLVVWIDTYNDDFDINKMKQNINKQYSHDNIFHTILGILEIQTSVYRPDMDIMEYAESRVR